VLAAAALIGLSESPARVAPGPEPPEPFAARTSVPSPPCPRPPATREPLPLLEALRAAGEETDPGLLEALALGESDARVRVRALERLAETRGAAARSFLLTRALDASEPDKVRRAAARALGMTGPGSAKAVLDLLDAAPPRPVLEGATAALASCAEEPAAAACLERVLIGRGAIARRAALDGLRRSPSPGAIRVAATALGDDRMPARDRVRLLEVLGSRKCPEAVPAACGILHEPGAPLAVRVAAVDLLGAIGLREVLPALRDLPGDAPVELRLRVTAAASRILRRDPGVPHAGSSEPLD
jgi:HEAT repeat protein